MYLCCGSLGLTFRSQKAQETQLVKLRLSSFCLRNVGPSEPRLKGWHNNKCPRGFFLCVAVRNKPKLIHQSIFECMVTTFVCSSVGIGQTLRRQKIKSQLFAFHFNRIENATSCFLAFWLRKVGTISVLVASSSASQ